MSTIGFQLDSPTGSHRRIWRPVVSVEQQRRDAAAGTEGPRTESTFVGHPVNTGELQGTILDTSRNTALHIKAAPPSNDRRRGRLYAGIGVAAMVFAAAILIRTGTLRDWLNPVPDLPNAVVLTDEEPPPQEDDAVASTAAEPELPAETVTVAVDSEPANPAETGRVADTDGVDTETMTGSEPLAGDLELARTNEETGVDTGSTDTPVAQPALQPELTAVAEPEAAADIDTDVPVATGTAVDPSTVSGTMLAPPAPGTNSTPTLAADPAVVDQAGTRDATDESGAAEADDSLSRDSVQGVVSLDSDDVAREASTTTDAASDAAGDAAGDAVSAGEALERVSTSADGNTDSNTSDSYAADTTVAAAGDGAESIEQVREPDIESPDDGVAEQSTEFVDADSSDTATEIVVEENESDNADLVVVESNINAEDSQPILAPVEQSDTVSEVIDNLDITDISDLISTANILVAEDKLAHPPEDNAVEVYQAVLAIEPDNIDARAGLENIAGIYLDAATEKVRQPDLALAALEIERGLKARPDHPRLIELQGEVRNMIEANAAYEEAENYFFGLDGPIDLVRSCDRYLEAAEKGHSQAALGLGICFANGFGFEQDEQQAVRWMNFAAEAEEPEAMYNLALGLLFGDSPDPERAANYIRKAADLGYERAYRVLGWMHQTGTGVEQSTRDAIKWGFRGVPGCLQ